MLQNVTIRLLFSGSVLPPPLPQPDKCRPPLGFGGNYDTVCHLAIWATLTWATLTQMEEQDTAKQSGSLCTHRYLTPVSYAQSHLFQKNSWLDPDSLKDLPVIITHSGPSSRI